MLNAEIEPRIAARPRAGRSRYDSLRFWTNIGLLNALIIGLVVCAFHGGHITTSIAWGGASLASGGLLGFLFGIPGRQQGGVHINQPGVAMVDTNVDHASGKGGVGTQGVTVAEAAPAPAAAAGSATPAKPPAPSSAAGSADHSDASNLEQVSDWVTKLLLGGGLTQLQNIPNMVWNLAYIVAVGINTNAAATDLDIRVEQSFAAGLLIYFFITGFFGGYLITKLQLGRRII